MRKRNFVEVPESVAVASSSPELRTMYVAYASGAVAFVESNEETISLPDGTKEITRQEYEARLAELKAANAKHVAALRADDERRTREDYEALSAAGVQEATARRLSGYTGEL
ncbi:hypothetical protein ACFSKW_39465 [Nonomuraea mangrovi]|uniref:Uncharacterized protein n=1 Tax=Nonomuraea mangrovi TaxID=2316207 RepID=A0ABW4T8R8_9ACTN